MRQEITLTNEALVPQKVEVRYLPDGARFALAEEEESFDECLTDGTLRWVRTLPAATKDAKGALAPASLELSLALKALPLPPEAGFADARDQWQLHWLGTVKRGAWQAVIVTPRIQTTWETSAETARAGDLVEFFARMENKGGAGERIGFSLQLPKGFRYPPEQMGVPAPQATGDMLLWEVQVPPGKREAEGKVVPGKAELRFVLRMEEDALAEDEGWRTQAFAGWAGGERLAPVAVTLQAARIHARQEISVTEAVAGEEIVLRTFFENAGGAEGTAVWTQTLPDGLVYVPEADKAQAPETDAQGRLVYTVEVPAAPQAQGGLAGPSVVERALRLRLTEEAAEECVGGRRQLKFPATVGLQALPAQTLTALCPDVTVQALAERAEVTPGSLCVITLRATNRGPAGAPVALEVEIPEGFTLATQPRSTASPQPEQAGRSLRWNFDIPAATPGDPAVVEVVYPLRAEPLARDQKTREVIHGARFAVADGVLHEALTAKVEVARRGLFDVSGTEWWVMGPLAMLFVGVIVVFILLMRERKKDS